MPTRAGLDVIRELVAAARRRRPQILMMTAHATVESGSRPCSWGRSLPAKPFEIDELLAGGRAVEQQRCIIITGTAQRARRKFATTVIIARSGQSCLHKTARLSRSREALADSGRDRPRRSWSPAIPTGARTRGAGESQLHAIRDLLESELFGPRAGRSQAGDE